MKRYNLELTFPNLSTVSLEFNELREAVAKMSALATVPKSMEAPTAFLPPIDIDGKICGPILMAKGQVVIGDTAIAVEMTIDESAEYEKTN